MSLLKRIPLIPTLLVLLAVGTMIRLGFWQLERLHQKQAMLRDYRAALTMTAEAAWPRDGAGAGQVLYRRSHVICDRVLGFAPVGGRNARGESGWAQVAQCAVAGGGEAKIVLGWSPSPQSPQWNGGEVRGTIAAGPRLIADPPLAGLQANARPDPADIPNNHLSYAVQWFLFALTALVIYALALRGRRRGA